MRVYILIAEHETVPGARVMAFTTKAARSQRIKEMRAEFPKQLTFERLECDLEGGKAPPAVLTAALPGIFISDVK